MSAVAIFLLCAGAAALGAATERRIRAALDPAARARRAAERLRPTPLDEAQDGQLVRVEGRVALETEPLAAPLSGRLCVHHEVGVERTLHGGGARSLVVERRSSPFAIVDATGRARVDPSGAIVQVVLDHRWATADLDPETRFAFERLLFSGGIADARSLGDQLRYVEGALELSELVTVVGVARVEADGSAHAYREGKPRMRLEAPEGGALFVSDDLHYA